MGSPATTHRNTIWNILVRRRFKDCGPPENSLQFIFLLMLTPEDLARETSDHLATAVGWAVLDGRAYYAPANPPLMARVLAATKPRMPS
jgi:hypothetical protein